MGDFSINSKKSMQSCCMTFFLLFEEVCLINLYLLLLLLIEYPNQKRIEEKQILHFYWFILNISTRINTGTLRHSLQPQIFLHYFHFSSSASQIISRYLNLFLYKYFPKSM